VATKDTPDEHTGGRQAHQPEGKPPNPFGKRSVRHPETGTRLTALEIHENIRAPAEEELERPASSLFFSSLAAGMLIGFSLLASAFVFHYVPQPYAHPFSSLVYPVGFMFVIMGRSELFTENTLEPVIPLLHKRDMKTFRQLLRMWGILIVGNLFGALIFAWVLGRTTMIEPAMHKSIEAVSAGATAGGFGDVFYKAIFGGWLIALLAWLLASTVETTAQLFLIWVTTVPIAAFHFRHSIAGAVEAFYRAITGSATWGSMLGDYIVPALLGNAVGGVLLVALFNYAQVAEEHESG
jgi:formate/nitrite transporter FocA (FNT family)